MPQAQIRPSSNSTAPQTPKIVNTLKQEGFKLNQVGNTFRSFNLPFRGGSHYDLSSKDWKGITPQVSDLTEQQLNQLQNGKTITVDQPGDTKPGEIETSRTQKVEVSLDKKTGTLSTFNVDDHNPAAGGPFGQQGSQPAQ